MIANAAVLAIWLHSADVELVQISNQTEINYAKRYEIYLAQICHRLLMMRLLCHRPCIKVTPPLTDRCRRLRAQADKRAAAVSNAAVANSTSTKR
ncbi:hypothetical protein B0H14DRAFT_2881032 [Mycena olivaceomarginata]|nr:hypothetical protein B0H14DRAFT_2881032 [Mycena olivaceomarginata]